jgi:hypothetical protein
MRVVSVLLPVLALAGCASTPLPPMSDAAPTPSVAPSPSQVPASLRPPAGQVWFMEALASGVQIYDCAPKADGSGFAWKFRAPEATLADRDGKPLGKHYAGPTWEALDGSKVVGEVVAREPGPMPATAIPWLLLSAKRTADGPNGAGTFSAVKSIQRLSTGGGVEPAEPCTADQAGRVARVDYSATYQFYR